VSRGLARLLLDTLRLTPSADPADLAERWARPDVAAKTDAIAAWIAWEQGEQWLLRRLGDHGALSEVPAKLVAALQRAARRDAKFGMAVDADTAEAVRILAAQGVPCVLLKGPARRAAVASLAMADARLTRDVDVLVPAGDAERAWLYFRSRGYAPYQYDPANVPPGESELQGPSPNHLRTLARESGAAVELHFSTERDLPPAQAWDRLWSSARVLSWQGLEVRVPSFTELLWQAITHADVARPAGWSLRYWLDAASVLAAQPVEWDTIDRRLRSTVPPGRALALRWLSVAGLLAGADPPPALTPLVPLAVERLISWRLAVLARGGSPMGWREKLLDEGTRAEVGLPLAPLVSGRAWPIHVRRRSATLLARAAYVAWRFQSRAAASSHPSGRASRSAATDANTPPGVEMS
jgi:hypothetical protein